MQGGKPAWARRSALSHGYWSQWRQQPSAAFVFENLAEQPNVEYLEKALLLQQASFSYLLRPVPRLRKYSYQMSQSADHFSQANQVRKKKKILQHKVPKILTNNNNNSSHFAALARIDGVQGRVWRVC